MNFKSFLIESYMSDVRKTLGKLPKKHSALLKGYKFKFEDGNELKGDGEHIGFIDEDKKLVTIASPWNYGREFTLLHEIGHAVWKYFVNDKLRKKWTSIVEKTKHKQSQGAEELFSMAYASAYVKNKIEIHCHPEWESFIKNLPK
jgi:hypothetical protein